MSDRCTGHCCRVFPLPKSPTEIREWLDHPDAHAYFTGIADPETARAILERDGAEKVRLTLDNRQVFEMVIPLADRLEDLPPDLRALFGDQTRPFEIKGFYTCRNLDTETGDCTIYESRPMTCRDYPYERSEGCQFSGCTAACAKGVSQ